LNVTIAWFELDTTYQMTRFLNWAGVIDMSQAQRMRYSAESARAA
jgi:hypothetical protein